MTNLHRQNFELICQLPDEEIKLDEAALLIAAEAQPDLDISYYLEYLNEMAVDFDASIGKRTQGGVSVSTLINYIHNTESFGGNTNDYYTPDNNFLNRVIETKVGIPISLALIHISLGWRLGIPVQGINFPGHFLVTYGNDPSVIVDPFAGRTLSYTDCENLLKQIGGPKLTLEAHHLNPASNKSILIRILDNLKNIYWKKNDWEETLSCIERQIMLEPSRWELKIQQGTIYEMQGYLPLAQLTYTNILQKTQDDKLKGLVGARLLAMQSSRAKIH